MPEFDYNAALSVPDLPPIEWDVGRGQSRVLSPQHETLVREVVDCLWREFHLAATSVKVTIWAEEMHAWVQYDLPADTDNQVCNRILNAVRALDPERARMLTIGVSRAYTRFECIREFGF